MLACVTLLLLLGTLCMGTYIVPFTLYIPYLYSPRTQTYFISGGEKRPPEIRLLYLSDYLSYLSCLAYSPVSTSCIPYYYVFTGAHLERATYLFSCNGVFTSKVIFRLNFPLMRLPQKPDDQLQEIKLTS